MSRKIKILITSAGSTNGVNVIKSLQRQKEVGVFLVAVDSDSLAAGFFLADKYFTVPRANDKNFIKEVLRICRKEKIEIIIPTHSYELPFFTQHQKVFSQNNIRMAISPYETLLVTDDKIKTNKFFKSLLIPCPKIYTQDEIKNQAVNFPVFIKPVQGSGSKNSRKIENIEELNFFTKYISNNLVQEFAEGDEYTIDGVCDINGKMIAASPRVRLETKGGLAIKSITKADSQMVGYAKKIVEALHIVGPFNIQCFKSGKEIKFIEINSRFPSGGLPLTDKAGLNIPLLIVKNLLGMKIRIPKVMPGVVMTRYYEAIVLKKGSGKYKVI